MAGPAIGVNLIAAKETMRSTSYHYDDVSGVLLLLAVLVILSTKIGKNIGNYSKVGHNRYFYWLGLLGHSY